MGKNYFTLTISTGYLSLMVIFVTVFFLEISSFYDHSQFNEVNQVIILDQNFVLEEQCLSENPPLLTLSTQRPEIQPVSLQRGSLLPPLKVNSVVSDRTGSTFTLFLINSIIYYPWLDRDRGGETGREAVVNFANSPSGPTAEGLDPMAELPVQQDGQQPHLAVILQSREG